MRQASAEGPARPDRMVGDMPRHDGEQPAEAAVDGRDMKRGVPHRGADHQGTVLDAK